jgi:hypothetical protein
MRPLPELLAQLPLEPSPSSSALAGRMRWVHRTGKRGGWQQQTELRPQPTDTPAERDAGLLGAVYFFLGAGAYPKGLVAFVVELPNAAGTFTPFDSGGLLKGIDVLGADGRSMDEERRRPLWNQWRGDLADVLPFAARWVSNLFDDPARYLTGVEPDRPPAHGAVFRGRLAWTIEAQVASTVDLSERATAVLVGRRDLVDDLPSGLLRFVVLPESDWTEDRFHDYIAAHVLTPEATR